VRTFHKSQKEWNFLFNCHREKILELIQEERHSDFVREVSKKIIPS
jgi:hypothetical protein